MMGKTHITVGITTALLVMRPTDFAGSGIAVLGGSIGGIICDIEVRSNRRCRDALHARFIVSGITAVTLLIDIAISGPLTEAATHSNPWIPGLGATVVVGTALYSRLWSRHRGFSHSLLALGLFVAGLAAVLPSLAFAFGLGFVSHVLLDLLNKKPVQLLYPSKRGDLCLRLCYANGHTNTVIMWAGALGIVGGLALPFV